MEVDNTWCLTEHGNDWSTSVTSQLECQDLCLKNPSCVGMSYSYREGMRNTCFVCNTVRLNEFNRNSFGFAFYRAPGEVFIYYQTHKMYNNVYHVNNELVYFILIMFCS